MNVRANENVKCYLDTHPSIVYKDIAYAQFIVETGHFTSRRFMKDNNIAGIKYKGARLAMGKRRAYAIYASWTTSIEEYARIQARLIKLTNTKTREEYFRKVLPKYAIDKKYPQLIRALCKLLPKHTNS
jgi:uncharacterized FlgJ-related protein